MASDVTTLRSPSGTPPPPGSTPWKGRGDLGSIAFAIFRGLASLKFTVILFAFSLLLVMVGTLAQVEKNMWQVMADYFRAFWAYVELKVFFPESFFPGIGTVPGGFWMPGGWTLGTCLGLNLFAAHATRFHVQAKGNRLVWGLAVMALGLLASILVILAGHNSRGIQGGPWISYDSYWQLLRGAAVVVFAVAVYRAFHADPRHPLSLWPRIGIAIGCGCLCGLLLVWGGGTRLSDPSMRILWQLGQSLVAGGIFLAGAVLVFKRRGGVVAIHAGIALLMCGELLVSLMAVEEQIILREGARTTFARQVATMELAIVDPSDSKLDTVTVVPEWMLRNPRRIESPQLPFQLEVVDYIPNARLAPVTAENDNPATAGFGLRMRALPYRSSGGAEAGGSIDIPAMYVKVIAPSLTPPPVLLLSQQVNESSLFPHSMDDGGATTIRDFPESVTVDGKTYQLGLRTKRNYKPYSVELLSVQKNDYVGTTTPKDYSSYVNLDDPTRGQRLENYRIWMNNPLRYGGETFYQSNYSALADGTKLTTLAVVTNAGWMIPYVACAFVGLGMLVHFGGGLSRFIERRIRETAGKSPSIRVTNWQWWIIPGLAAAGTLCVLVPTVRTPPRAAADFDLGAFGRIPVQFEGRTQPLDTLARNTLRILSQRQSYRELKGDETPAMAAHGPTRPAIAWLLNLMVMDEGVEKLHIFRIEHDAVRELLKLPRRKHMRYALDEFRGQLSTLFTEADKAKALNDQDPSRLTLEQRKILELAGRLKRYGRVRTSFLPSSFSSLPTQEELAAAKDSPATQERINKFMQEAMAAMARAKGEKSDGLPLVIPGDKSPEDWSSFASSADLAYVNGILKGEPPPSHLVAWGSMLDAYAQGEAGKFNAAVEDYRRGISTSKVADTARLDFESSFNRVQPFMLCMYLYVFSFLVTGLSWFAWHRPLQRTAFWLITWTLVLHALALAARVYISGRPPITNLYTTATFIGWAGVVLCLALEGVFRLGILNAVAAVCGFSTLFIAHNLAGEGDTFTVLQAVLDTQFWLATHVISINTGYAMPLVAGGIGIVFVLTSLFAPARHIAWRKDLARMIYGTICAAMFFSFVGTVLGGLWADDSWGRFWGWDPKENGALMIVLWNALILHARWDGMLKERGMALLAILGAAVTTWSWFGVNELGIGLHAYGFTEGVLRNLLIFDCGLLLVCAAGVLRWYLFPRKDLGPIV